MLPFIYPSSGEATEHQNNQDLEQGTIDGQGTNSRTKNPRTFMNAKPGTLHVLYLVT